jgi:hypothetical protein
MSAIVVPTATDLAYGLQFVDDRTVLAPTGLCLRPWESPRSGFGYCKVGVTGSQKELGGPITTFHRLKKECIATGGRDAYGAIPTPSQNSEICPSGALTFDKLYPTTN